VLYNGARTHLSLEKDTPVSRAVDRAGHISPTLGGLHHQYARILFTTGTAPQFDTSGYTAGVLRDSRRHSGKEIIPSRAGETGIARLAHARVGLILSAPRFDKLSFSI